MNIPNVEDIMREYKIAEKINSDSDKGDLYHSVKYALESACRDTLELNLKINKETVSEIKNRIATSHGYESNILGSSWDFAMQLTHRTKNQIKLYEELVSELSF